MRFVLQLTLVVSLILVSAASAIAQEDVMAIGNDAPTGNDAPAGDAAPTGDQSKKAGDNKPAEESKPSGPDHKTILKDAKTIEGMITLYRKDEKMFGELKGGHYSSEYIVLISIARGIGRGWLIGGMSWNDDWVWTFRKVDERVHVIRKNVRFRAAKGSPEATAVRHAYTDSVLFSLPIITKGPQGGDLIDLTPIFMSDLPQISQMLPGFSFSAPKSSWSSVKGFKDNVELEVAATYASSGRERFESVADTRGVTINVHYSISKLPTTGYKPRLADDRIGYFLTVIKDYSNKNNEEQFTRYINRWHLEKADAQAKQSPPKRPIIFWIENTVPYSYRKIIREAILEWNKGFETAGFVDAIEVRQQPENAPWDPEDINYNTIRWMTSDAPFSGIGPSRFNPYTGQILDADILLNSDVVQFYEYHFETLTPESIAEATGGPIDLEAYRQQSSDVQFGIRGLHRQCRRAHGLARDLAFSWTVLAAQEDDDGRAEAIEQLTLQGLKGLVMHEVGHTLGLRHNFKASTYLSLDEMNDREKVEQSGMLASVMDYDPANIRPKGDEQGYYFTPTIGPYDIWAIEYGYTQLTGGTNGEQTELKKIATRSGEPGLPFATDEDTRGVDPDPDSGVMDLGNDAIAYAQMRAQLVREAIPGLVDRMTKDGDSYAQSRRAFNSLLHHHGVAMFHVARYVGGIYVSRSHKGDKEAPNPLRIVAVEKQRESQQFLQQEVFGPEAFQYPPELYNLMLSSRWYHWGTVRTERPDYPIHDGISAWQDRILQKLLSSLTLSRIHDNELKLPADQEAMTTAELIEGLTQSIFAEVDSIEGGEYTNRKPAINSLRRNLQRMFLKRISNIALGRTGAPQDCQTVAYAVLVSLQERIEKLLAGEVALDSYSRAHLQETAVRIGKVLEARLTLTGP